MTRKLAKRFSCQKSLKQIRYSNKPVNSHILEPKFVLSSLKHPDSNHFLSFLGVTRTSIRTTNRGFTVIWSFVTSSNILSIYQNMFAILTTSNHITTHHDIILRFSCLDCFSSRKLRCKGNVNSFNLSWVPVIRSRKWLGFNFWAINIHRKRNLQLK